MDREERVITDRRERENLTDGTGVRDRFLESPPPRPPLRFVVEDTGSGVRVTVVNDGPLGGRLNGAVRYDVYWAETVDTSTAAGKAAGFARAVCLAPPLPATNVDHTQSSGLFDDPKYASGYFYVCGVDQHGQRSEPSEPARITTGPIDYTIPGDVGHLQVSESGVPANGTVFSELSITADPPDTNIQNFGGVQLYLKDFAALGDVQEGYFHKWNGSGGINFAVLYPIPRRKGTFNITVTNGSPNVTAASGLLAFAQTGDNLELLGRRAEVSTVTDTQITLTANWSGPTDTTSDWSIIAKVTVFAVSISKAGTRRADTQNAPSVAVLMDGELSAPNAPSGVSATPLGNFVRVSWDQVAGRTIAAYNVYRSDGTGTDSGMSSVPPLPTSGTTVLLDRVPQNPNLLGGSTYATIQFDDSNFTAHEIDTNASFRYYVTTTNIRGDESAASSDTATCRPAGAYEIDPTIPTRNAGKNFLWNGNFRGTEDNQVLANDTSQDVFIFTDASNLPGRPYGAASGQADGSGKYRGYTRWESSDGGGGAAGTVVFKRDDSVLIPAPGATKVWYVYQEIGAWGESAGAEFRKIQNGEVLTLSVHVTHNGTAPVGGIFYFYLDQYDDNTFLDRSLRRYRDSLGVLTTDQSGLVIDPAIITLAPIRLQAAFQIDSALSSTEQIRVNFAWEGGTAGDIVIQRAMFHPGEHAAQWTDDMGDTTITVPGTGAAPPPVGDEISDRTGDARRIAYEP